MGKYFYCIRNQDSGYLSGDNEWKGAKVGGLVKYWQHCFFFLTLFFIWGLAT